MNKQLLATLLLAFLLCGCAERTAPPHENSAPQSSAPASSEAAVAPAPPAISPIRHSGEACRWNGDGSQLVLRSGNTLTRVGLDNQATKTVTFGASDPAQAQLSFNDTRLLRTVSQTRLLQRSGVWMLTNAVLYDLNGEVLREFPDTITDEIKRATEPYEQAAYSLEATWLDDTHAVLNTGALLAVLDTDSGGVTLVEDYREAKRQGYTIGASSSYGIRQSWTEGGYFYYLASADVPNPSPVYPLVRVDAAGKRDQVFDGKQFFDYRIKDRLIVALAEEPSEGCAVWYATADDFTPRRVGSGAIGAHSVSSDGRYITYANMGKDTPESPLQLCRFDTETGETIAMQPALYEEKPAAAGDRTFGLLATRETKSGAQFLYLIENLIEEKDAETGEMQGRWVSKIACYDFASDKKQVLYERTYCSTAGVNPPKTHIVIESDDGYYVVPLALGE